MADPRDYARPDAGQNYRPDRSVGVAPAAASTGLNVVQAIGPQPNSVTDQATKALSGLMPALEAIAEKQTKQQTEEELQAGREAALAQGVEYAEAVSSGKLPANQSPFFMKGYKTQYGENLGQQWAMEAKVKWEQSAEKNSDDPTAIRAFLTSFTQEKLKTAPSQDADIRAGMLPYLGKAHGALIAAQTEYSGKKVQEQHLENVGIAIMTDLDLLGSGKMTRDQFLKSLEGRDAAALSIGVNKDDMTKSIVAAVTDKARRTGNMSVLKILDDYKFVGKNPKYAAAIRGAEDAIISRAASNESRAWTAQQRARQVREDTGLTAIYDKFFDQLRNGEDVRITPQIATDAKAIGTSAALPQVMAFFKTMKDQSQETPVKEQDRMANAILNAGPQGLAALTYLVTTDQVKGTKTYDYLRRIAETGRDLTNDRVFLDHTQRIFQYGQRTEYGKAIINPMAVEKTMNEFRYRYTQWVSQNPATDPQQRDQYAAKLSDEMKKTLDTYKLGAGSGNDQIDEDFELMRGTPTDNLHERRKVLEERLRKTSTTQPKK